MKGRVAGRVDVDRAPLDDAALLDLVRARVVQGHDRATLPARLNLEHGVDAAAAQRALAAYDDEVRNARAADRRSWGRAGAAAAAAGTVAFAVVYAFGGVGAALLSGCVAAGAIGVIVVELGRRGRP